MSGYNRNRPRAVCSVCGKLKPIVSLLKGHCDACYRNARETQSPGYKKARHERHKISQAANGKAWRRKKQLKAYGLTDADYRAMVEAQASRCAICEQPERIVRNGELEPLCVDHDHQTGRVRGLLCRTCNSALGKFKDSPEMLRRALAYMEGYG